MGNTVLIWAAGKGHDTCLERLIQAGVDVNRQSYLDYTALMWAAASGYDSCLEVLIQAGADVNIQSVKGNTALKKYGQHEMDKIKV